MIGMGATFEVHVHYEKGRELALKRLLPRMRNEPKARAALAREAHFLTAIKHPALPELVRIGSDEKGPFVIETRVNGASIRQIVEYWSGRGGAPHRLSVHIAAEAFRTLGEVAAMADSEGPLSPVHGDIGPDHLFLGPAGEVRFIDFGAGRFRNMPAPLLGEDRGTLPFSAPEVVRGDALPSPASDVYSMAATVLFLIAGRSLCDAKETSAMLLEVGSRGIKRELFNEAKGFRKDQREALMAALSLDPQTRIKNAQEIFRCFD